MTAPYEITFYVDPPSAYFPGWTGRLMENELITNQMHARECRRRAVGYRSGATSETLLVGKQ